MILHPADAASLILTGEKYVFYVPGSADLPRKWDWAALVEENLRSRAPDMNGSPLHYGIDHGDSAFTTPGAILRFLHRNSDPPRDYVIIFANNESNAADIQTSLRNVYAVATAWGARVIEVDNFLTDEDRQTHAVPPRDLLPPDPSLPPCIIVDLDGTLANSEHRRPYGDVAKIHLDTPYDHVLKIVRAFCFAEVFFVTGRGREVGEFRHTVNWLRSIGLDPTAHPYTRNILARNLNDNRSDDVVKLELYVNNIAGRFNPILVLDDRPRVIRMWNRLGLPVLAANPYLKGEF